MSEVYVWKTIGMELNRFYSFIKAPPHCLLKQSSSKSRAHTLGLQEDLGGGGGGGLRMGSSKDTVFWILPQV